MQNFDFVFMSFLTAPTIKSNCILIEIYFFFLKKALDQT